MNLIDYYLYKSGSIRPATYEEHHSIIEGNGGVDEQVRNAYKKKRMSNPESEKLWQKTYSNELKKHNLSPWIYKKAELGFATRPAAYAGAIGAVAGVIHGALHGDDKTRSAVEMGLGAGLATGLLIGQPLKYISKLKKGLGQI